MAFDILKNLDFDGPIAQAVAQHRERLDGSGYPYGLSGRDVLFEARVLAVADVVAAFQRVLGMTGSGAEPVSTHP